MQDAKVRERDGKRYLEGYFAVFNRDYYVFSDWVESIAPGAFRSSIEDGEDIKILWNHNHDIVLGSTAAKTASLREDNVGLFGSVLINEDDQDAKNAYARVNRGDVDGCSIGFMIKRQEESWEGDLYRTRLLDLQLYEASPCTFPAYTDTSINARTAAGYSEAKAQYERALQEKTNTWREQMLSRLKGDAHGA